jgi:hypothetical protein
MDIGWSVRVTEKVVTQLKTEALVTGLVINEKKQKYT